MGFATETETIVSAKKRHQCSWCAERIEIGETYLRYRWYNGSDASTVKMHPECISAMRELIKLEGGYEIEFGLGDNPRGCLCGHDRGCERCAEKSLAVI